MAMNQKFASTIALSSLTAALLTLSGCGSSSSSAPAGTTPACDSSAIDVVLSSSIDTNMTLDATKVYGMNGKVSVTNGAILTIPEGTTIAGCAQSSFMVIEPGSKLMANGTLAKPVVFTSQKDVMGLSASNQAGEWGGLVLAGNAYVHGAPQLYEADETVAYGSTDHANDTDSSGELNFVVIKHTGYEVEKDKELNGLSLAGVGSGTLLNNVAIIGGLDDGLEMWGGLATINGLYVYNAQDDSVDTDLGNRSTITNVLVQQNNVDSINNHDSSAMEFGNDNNPIVTDDTNATQPVVSNFTAYIKGGGFYNKNDAGFKWSNVKFISDKSVDTEMVHFRSTDAYDTGAKHVDGDVCFFDSKVALTDVLTYSDLNSKPDTNLPGMNTAYDYFVTNKLYAGSGVINIDSTVCTGADEATIWKGKAGSYEPLEKPTEILPNVIMASTTLTADKVWLIDGKVNVQSPAVLTIDPGTTVAGATPNSFMVIEPGAQIDANGTIDKPIVFTSKKDVDGNSQDNVAGEWGGLVLAGNAYTHYGVATYEADPTVEFGCNGTTVPCLNTQSSGSLQYVVIKHTGYEVEKDKELNGLSLAGVGSGTVLNNIAIIGGLDDGLEIWGGRADINGLYVYNAQDDSVDTDLGYRGNISNVLVQQVNVDSTNNHDSSAMEFGNDNNTITTGDTNATQPVITNFTAYVKGGGFYNKYDAGFKWSNVKFISAKAVDTEMIHFRGTDAYDTGAKHVDGDVCFYDSAVILTDATTYSNVNSKPDTNLPGFNTAYDFFVTNTAYTGAGTLNVDDSTTCAGATELNVWKGKAGSNDALETVPAP